MRELLKEDLLFFSCGPNIGRIDWNSMVGKNVRFKYDDVFGVVYIKSYINKIITVLYNCETYNMDVSQFRQCRFGSMLDIWSKKYKFNIGDVINNKIILNHIRMSQGESTTKGYEYKCLVDGYVGNMIESSIQNHGCPICSNTKVKIGINDIGTTHPHLMKFFKNKDDILKYTAHSGKEVLFICDICNTTKKSKIYNITNNGFKCMVCGDGSSYSERFLYSLLNQCNIEFVHEKILSKDFIRRYDIYFEYNNKKYIIETHGMQHYEQTSNKNFTKINDQKNIDVSKRLFAINNGIDFYIELDCRYSQKEWIKKSILNSDLCNVIPIENVDWEMCEKDAENQSKIKEVWDLWNGGIKSIVSISKLTKLSRSTIWKYINIGDKLGICDYDKTIALKEAAERTRKIRSKEVSIFKDGECLATYPSIESLCRSFDIEYGIKFSSSKISRVCNNKQKTHKGYHFQFKI